MNHTEERHIGYATHKRPNLDLTGAVCSCGWEFEPAEGNQAERAWHEHAFPAPEGAA